MFSFWFLTATHEPNNNTITHQPIVNRHSPLLSQPIYCRSHSHPTLLSQPISPPLLFQVSFEITIHKLIVVVGVIESGNCNWIKIVRVVMISVLKLKLILAFRFWLLKSIKFSIIFYYFTSMILWIHIRPSVQGTLVTPLFLFHASDSSLVPPFHSWLEIFTKHLSL